MLRLYQHVGAHLRTAGSLAGVTQLRTYADLPVPRPADVKPFDPNGPLSQLEAYLPEESPLLGNLRKITQLLGELDRRATDKRKNAPKEINWTQFQQQTGYPPELVQTIKTTMEEEKKSRPQAPQITSFMELYNSKVKPAIAEEQAKIRQELQECKDKLRELDEMEARLDDLTVDEVLEKNPDIAREIKQELESGQFFDR